MKHRPSPPGSYVIQLQGYASGSPCPLAGQYVRRFDPNAQAGRGLVEGTTRVREAKHYPTAEAAIEDWWRVSATTPVHIDGKPNRPLTAYTIHILRETGHDEDAGPRVRES